MLPAPPSQAACRREPPAVPACRQAPHDAGSPPGGEETAKRRAEGPKIP